MAQRDAEDQWKKNQRSPEIGVMGRSIQRHESVLSRFTPRAHEIQESIGRIDLFAVSPLDLGDAQVIVRIPNAFARLLCRLVIQMLLPGGDGFFVGPVGNRDAESVLAARTFSAEETGLFRRK